MNYTLRINPKKKESKYMANPNKKSRNDKRKKTKSEGEKGRVDVKTRVELCS